IPAPRRCTSSARSIASKACVACWVSSKACAAVRPAATTRCHTTRPRRPGLPNAAANLHNAKKAGSGIVNIVGEHALYHIKYDTPLTADIEGIARPFSHWVKTSPTSKTVAADGAAAIQAARVAPGQIATLILPADTAWTEADGV